jgi:bla regulator protein BlaR1
MPRRIFGTLLALLLAAAVLAQTPQQPTGQLSGSSHEPADWQSAAGGKLAFEAVSVMRDAAGGPMSHNPQIATVSMNPQGDNAPTDGLFQSANWPVFAYIAFAYKLTPDQVGQIQRQLPDWARNSSYDIEGRATGSPLRDQVRLMVQSVLADRFKMKTHMELRQIPVYALVVDEPGKLGSGLRAHVNDPACAAPGASCRGGLSFGGKDGVARLVAQDATMSRTANNLQSYGHLDRPVVDQTNLAGGFDFTLEFAQPASGGFSPDSSSSEPTFTEALKDQLGLKLKATDSPVNVLVIDHIEEPSPN